VILGGGQDELREVISEVKANLLLPTPKFVVLATECTQVVKGLAAEASLPAPVQARVLRQKLCEIFQRAAGDACLLDEAHLPAAPGSPLATGGICRVLVADDNLLNQRLAGALLRKLGCEVDTADSGAEALEKVSQQEYGLVFMDLVMPELDGFAATLAIRQLAGSCGAVPIVALTASAITDEREHCYAVGMDGFLTKPIRSDQLAECLAKWMKP
jgi:CheY-like chemotaxis protein